MSDSPESETAREHERLRLSQEDVLLVWGILDGHREAQRATGERWPRLDRILFDLEIMARKQELITND